MALHTQRATLCISCINTHSPLENPQGRNPPVFVEMWTIPCGQFFALFPLCGNPRNLSTTPVDAPRPLPQGFPTLFHNILYYEYYFYLLSSPLLKNERSTKGREPTPMKFSCEKALLQSAIATTARAVSPKSSIPALEGILVEAGDQLRLTGYNLETGIRTVVPAQIDGRAAWSSPPGSSARSSASCPTTWSPSPPTAIW